MPSYSPAIAFRRSSSSIVASRPGVELEPGRHAERAGLHRLAHESVHHAPPARSVGCGPETPAASRIALWPTNQARFGRVPDVREEVEVLAEGRPGDQRPVVAERVEPLAHGTRASESVTGRVAPAAVADDLGRHALADRALGGRVREQREVAVAVRVDEAGADDLPRRVDDARGGRRAVEPADLAIRPSSIATSPRNGGLPVPSATQPPLIRTSSTRAPHFVSLDPADVRPETRVEDVAQAVPEEVEAEHDDHDREPGEDRQPRLRPRGRSGRSRASLPTTPPAAACRARGS